MIVAGDIHGLFMFRLLLVLSFASMCSWVVLVIVSGDLVLHHGFGDTLF